jgi:putative flavoprotein involved in K+ transport
VSEPVDVVIVGAGQAGLAVSRELTQAGVAHVVLERGRVGQIWRGRWDSFCLVIPNWFLQLPGHPYDGNDPDGFMPRDEVVAYLEGYAAAFDAPVREGIQVTALRPGRDGGFHLETSAGEILARTVVLSTGAYQRPHRPAGADTLPEDLDQIDAEDYRNPAELPRGPVLVVGSGQSGCQIAEELHQVGREVFLACGRAPWFPRRLGDRDLAWWALETGFLDAPLSSLPSPAARLAANVQATGAGGGHDLHYRTLRKLGVTLLGRFLGAHGRHARFAPDLGESVAWGDDRNAQLMDLVRKLVAERGLPPPEIPEPEPFNADAPEELNLSGFGAVVFTGGLSARLRILGPLRGRVRRSASQSTRKGPAPSSQGSTPSACTFSASASLRSSTGWARMPPSSPDRSPRHKSNQPRELANRCAGEESTSNARSLAVALPR